MELVGYLSKDEVKELKFIHLSNSAVGKDEYVLVEHYYNVQRGGWCEETYINIENGAAVYDFLDESYKNFKVDILVDNMMDYLYKYDMIKDEYDIKDIQNLKENLLNDPDLNIEKDKQLVK